MRIIQVIILTFLVYIALYSSGEAKPLAGKFNIMIDPK